MDATQIPFYELDGEQYFAIVDILLHTDIPKASLYNHLNGLQETPRKVKNKSYLSLSQVSRLFRLVEHLHTGGNIKSFLSSESGLSRHVEPSELATTDNDDATVSIEVLRELNELASLGSHVPTRYLANLLGVTPGTINNQGPEFFPYGFPVRLSPHRWGGSKLWQVSTPSRLSGD